MTEGMKQEISKNINRIEGNVTIFAPTAQTPSSTIHTLHNQHRRVLM
jgi:hypothetical protein